jgi:hypothetical protein
MNNAGDIKPNNSLFEVEGYDAETDEYSLIELDEYGGPSGYSTKRLSTEIYDFQNMKADHADYGTSQELFEDDYILSMYVHNLNQEGMEGVNEDNVVPHLNSIEVEINLLKIAIERAKGNDAEITAAKFRFANKFTPSDVKKSGPRSEAFRVANAVIKAKGSIDDGYRATLAAQIHKAALYGTTQKVANDRIRKFIYDNLDNKKNLNEKIRFKINKTASVNVNQQLENQLVSDNATANDKLRVGLMHAKYTRKTDGSDYIGIHNQMNIDIALEVNLGTENAPI